MESPLSLHLTYRWYPRSRGVYILTSDLMDDLPGSSPLARGLRGPIYAAHDGAGIIPARAGFTPLARAAHRRRGDHPRSRGVYDCAWVPVAPCLGSSPLARGLPGVYHYVDGSGGIIPARAGFTPAAGGARCCRADHPRSRGVYGSAPIALPAAPGSSPLARGLPARPPPRTPGARIIPARAGFTSMRVVTSAPRTDHPRSRGVYFTVDGLAGTNQGSSPLARGLRRGRRPGHDRGGIIPARAGFTSHRRGRRAPRGDHPRSRGVYMAALSLPVLINGSSPLARGLPVMTSRSGSRRGIIPARAGFTRAGRCARPASRDHPRSRGVYAASAARAGAVVGSSPLARGLPKMADQNAGLTRIIPARAGFTVTCGHHRRGRRDHPRSRGVYCSRP